MYDATFDDVRGHPQSRQTVPGLQDIQADGPYPLLGSLLEGPPGTGKALLSKAIAGEVNVPFIYASNVGSMFMGIGNLKVMHLFTKARKFSERYGGAVIVMDEFDAIRSCVVAQSM